MRSVYVECRHLGAISKLLHQIRSISTRADVARHLTSVDTAAAMGRRPWAELPPHLQAMLHPFLLQRRTPSTATNMTIRCVCVCDANDGSVDHASGRRGARDFAKHALGLASMAVQGVDVLLTAELRSPSIPAGIVVHRLDHPDCHVLSEVPGDPRVERRIGQETNQNESPASS